MRATGALLVDIRNVFILIGTNNLHVYHENFFSPRVIGKSLYVFLILLYSGFSGYSCITRLISTHPITMVIHLYIYVPLMDMKR